MEGDPEEGGKLGIPSKLKERWVCKDEENNIERRVMEEVDAKMNLFKDRAL